MIIIIFIRIVICFVGVVPKHLKCIRCDFWQSNAHIVSTAFRSQTEFENNIKTTQDPAAKAEIATEAKPAVDFGAGHIPPGNHRHGEASEEQLY